MRILIIGGAGFLGANLVRRCLSEANTQVTVMDSLDSRLLSSTDNLKLVMDRITFIKDDICNESTLKSIVGRQDVIFNCAGQTSHALSLKYPILDTNINCLGNLKLLEAIRHFNPRCKVIYPSSSTVIGEAVGDWVKDEHVEHPKEIYSANKGVVEKYYRIYKTLYDLNTAVLRFANLYGPYGKDSPQFGFVNYFIQQAWRDEVIEIFGSGDQLRNVMYVGDAVNALWQAIDDENFGKHAFFVVSDEHLSVREIAETIVKVFKRGRIKYVAWPDHRRRIEIGNARFSNAPFFEATGWRAHYKFVEGLEKVRDVLSEASIQAESECVSS